MTEGVEIAKLSLLSSSMYLFTIKALYFGNEMITESQSAIMDTGNTLISIPIKYKLLFQSVLSKSGLNCEIYQESNHQFYQLGCQIKDVDMIPDFQVNLNGVLLTIKGPQLIDVCETSPVGKKCMMNIEFQTGDMDQVILGKAFMTHTYTTFFLERSELWVAQPKIEKYKELASKKDHKLHNSATHKKAIFEVWNQEKFAHLAEIAKREHF